MDSLKNLRIAFVHDWLPLYGGAERVLEQMLRMLPRADLFSLIDAVPPEQRAFLQGREVHTSIIQKLPFGRSHYRHYFPIMPLVIEQFDLSAYDLIISSSYSFAKGVITGPNQFHVCYCHSPIRYAWDLQHQYLAQSGVPRGPFQWVVRSVLHYLRLWDVRTSNGVEQFAANSRYVARRIRKVYQRDSTVIHPPIDVNRFKVVSDKDDYYLTISRMVPYKRVDVVVDAFSRMPDRRLIVIGDGPLLGKIRAGAGRNVTFLGHTETPELIALLENARAFVFAAEEDFGIVTVEAQACGTPVIAYSRGGSAETVLDGETGVLFDEQSAAAVTDAVRHFESQRFDPGRIRRHAEQFSNERFHEAFRHWLTGAYREFLRENPGVKSKARDDAALPVPAVVKPVEIS